MTSDTQVKIGKIISQLKSEFYERDTIIEACWAAILSGNHVLLLGQPGTAKSMITDAICKRIMGTKYFQWLLTRFSTPEEIFGPVSLKSLENDEYRRITSNKLPEAHIAFLDEVWKANSAILNSMLTIINERKFDNGSTRNDVDLISVFGASNELPQDEELAALYDRFILRFDVPYIREASHWKSLISGAVGDTKSGGDTISLEELKSAMDKVKNVAFPDEVVNAMLNIKMDLEHEGIVASDRRWKQTVRVLQAWAWIHGRDSVEEQDLELLCEMLWREPEQRVTLVSKILSVTNPLNLEAVKYHDDCLGVFQTFSPTVSTSTKEEVAQKLRSALEQMDTTLKIADPAKSTKLKETRVEVAQWYRQVVQSIDL